MKSVVSFFLILSIMACPGVLNARSDTTNTGLPSLVESLRIKPPLDFCGERVPIDNQDVRERLDREMLLALWNRPQVILWIKRSNRHLPVIEKMLRESNMPEDLKYITLIESALRPHVGSAKGAIGFWQFTEGTAKKYDLRVDQDIDERRSIFASTRAALRCLKEFHKVFGSWTLAAAAFNMGKEGLQTEILAQKTNNYYHLYLPLETQWYVLRIIAAKLIITNPGKYGFHLTKEDLYPPLTYDRITIDCTERIPIQIIADAAKTHFKVVKDLNPEIRGYYLNKGHYTLSIPKGTSKRFHSQYKKLLKQWMAKKGEYIYVVKQGDNLSIIADRFDVPLPALFMWNNLNTDEPLHPGDRLVIYPNTKQKQ